MGIFLKALKMCVTKKVEWRGTAYSHTMAQDLGTNTSNPSPRIRCRAKVERAVTHAYFETLLCSRNSTIPG